MRLEELSVREVAAFWNSHREKMSPYELLRVLTITGGVPRYLEEIEPHLTAEQNIRLICFHRNGLLFGEFDRIFSDLFFSRAPNYTEILNAIMENPSSLAKIVTTTGLSSSTVSDLLSDLSHAGFVRGDPIWNLKTMKHSRIKTFRISDN
jgi:uncharacterized protein